MIDLRSDTVTVPCDAMRSAMSNAEVGDDVIDVDPTTAALQQKIAELTGKESAMFMPSGSMTNQTAVRLHCRPGDEFICEAGCHIYNYEQGAFAQLSQTVARCVDGPENIMQLDQINGLIRPNDEHAVQTRLLCLENTHNRGGGRILPYEGLVAMCEWAHANGLKTHLDGARLFNAVVASRIPAADWCQHFDTVSICFSKGLGAPVGSALCGPESMINTLRRHRKLFGGGMRQSGIISAGALFALENNIDRLAEDHSNAQQIADAVNETDGLKLQGGSVDTNIVIFHVDAEIGTARKFCDDAKELGAWMYPFGAQQVRAVTHMNISPSEAKQAGDIVKNVVSALLKTAV